MGCSTNKWKTNRIVLVPFDDSVNPYQMITIIDSYDIRGTAANDYSIAIANFETITEITGVCYAYCIASASLSCPS